MSCTGHHFSVHSPECKAHLSIQSNRPVQVEHLAPGSSAELHESVVEDNNQQQVMARWGSPYSVSLLQSERNSTTPSGQHSQIIQPASIRCQQQQQQLDHNDSDYTLVILDCSPTPIDEQRELQVQSSCRSPCTSAGGDQCCFDQNCAQNNNNCHRHHTAELILRQRHIDCHHHHHNQQVQNYESGSIADRSASQTTSRSEREGSSVLFDQNQCTSNLQYRQPLRQIQETEVTTTTTTSTADRQEHEDQLRRQHRQQQQQQRQWVSSRHLEDENIANFSNYYEGQQQQQHVSPSAPPLYSPQKSPVGWGRTVIKTIVTTHEDENEGENTIARQQTTSRQEIPSGGLAAPSPNHASTGQQQQQTKHQPREGTRIVKRWNWNKAEFVEEEVPDKPRPKPQPAPSSTDQQQRRRDAWNEEIRQNITISPVVPPLKSGNPDWLEYRVPDEQSVQSDPLYRDLMAELQKLEEGVTAITPNEPIITPDQTFQKPVFGQQIVPNDVELNEHESVEFVCRLIPSSDPTMRVEWTLNGRPLLESSRLTSEHDFGVVRLLIRRCEAEDSGIYECRAINSLGEAISRAKLLVHAKGNVQCESLHPAGLDKIRQLENPKPVDHVEEQNLQQPPKFLTHITDYVEKSEGESVHFECCLAPVDDPDMKTEWFFNGRPLVTGSRFHTIDDFGFIVLDIDWLFPRDTGEYVCRATNKYGTDFTRTVLRVRPDKNIVLDSQLAENADVTIDKIRQLEFPDVEPEEARADEPLKPAHFLMPLQTENNRREFVEGDNCHFEARVGPATDGELTVEWFHNDKPLISGHRFKPTFDFGHILLDILYVYPEDSGTYKCLARNRQGEAVSTFEIQVKGKPSLVYQSQLPKEMVGGVKKIEDMEAAWNMPPAEEEEEAPAERMAPQFVLEPKPCTAFEGSGARFCCRVLANPRARLTWFMNGQPIVPGARYKLTHDGMHHLTIPKCQLSDAGSIRVVARNLLGECQSQPVELTVRKKVDDYRGVLKNSPNPWYDEPTLRVYRRQRQSEDIEEDQDEDFAEFLQNFKRQQLKLQIQQATQLGSTSPLASETVIGYMEPETPDVNLLLASKSPLVEPGDLHPIVVEQMAVMAPAPSTIQRALESKDDFRLMQPHLVQHEATQHSSYDNPIRRDLTQLTPYSDSQQQQQQNQSKVVFGLNSSRRPNQGNNNQTNQQNASARYNQTIGVQRMQAQSPVPSLNGTGQQQDVEHGREVHSQTHKQLQVEHRPNQEILREIIEREIFEQEHSGFSKDNLVVREQSSTPVQRQDTNSSGRKSSQLDHQQTQLIATAAATTTTATTSTTSQQEVFVDEQMEPPEFTQKIQPCQAIDGDEAQFECAYKGDPQPTITWYCENRPIKASNLYQIETNLERKTSRLTIKRVTLKSSAVYTVKAENVAGSAKSSANLVVEPHPLPSSSLGGHARQVDSSAASINQSSTATTSTVSQYTDVRGQFIASDDQLTSGRETPESSISSQQNNKVIKSVRTRRLSPDQMASRIRASPEGFVPPTFLQTMYDLSAKSGDLVRLDVRLIGSQPMEIRWLKDGERVRPDKGHKLLLEGDLYTLLILECNQKDEGHYECCALNQIGESKCGAQLRVGSGPPPPPPPPQASPASSGLFGLSQNLYGQSGAVSSSSRTTTTISTATAASNIGSERAALLPQQTTLGQPKMHFGLTNKPRHQHQLTYTPSNEDSTQQLQQQSQIPLVPKLIKGLESQQVREGKSVTLRCQISAHPKAEIFWFKHGDKLIKPSKYFRIFKDNEETHCLKILEAFPEDQGEYKCMARAQNGSLETSATIQVIPNSPR